MSQSECPFRVGDRIREKQYNGRDRRVIATCAQCIWCRGIESGRTTQIDRKNWRRYTKVAENE